MKYAYRLKNFIVTFVLIFALLYIGSVDVNEQEKRFQSYCNDIKNDVHPDYKNMAAECKNISYK